MREAKPGERVIVCVLKRSTEACAGYLQALVDDGFIDPKQGATGTVLAKLEDAVTKWLCDNEYARVLIKREYGGDFNFGDLVDHLGGGYDDNSREPLKNTDLELYLRKAGFLGMEVEAFIATEPERTLWDYDDPLFDAETVKDAVAAGAAK